MEKAEFIQYLLNNNNSGYKTKENHIKNNFPNEYEDILAYNKKYFNENIPFTQKLYHYL